MRIRISYDNFCLQTNVILITKVGCGKIPLHVNYHSVSLWHFREPLEKTSHLPASRSSKNPGVVASPRPPSREDLAPSESSPACVRAVKTETRPEEPVQFSLKQLRGSRGFLPPRPSAVAPTNRSSMSFDPRFGPRRMNGDAVLRARKEEGPGGDGRWRKDAGG